MGDIKSFLTCLTTIVPRMIYGPKIEGLRVEIANLVVSTAHLFLSCDSRIRTAFIGSQEIGLMAEYRKLAAEYLRIVMNSETISIQLRYNYATVKMCEQTLQEVKACYDEFKLLDIRIRFIEGDYTELNLINWSVLETQMKS